MAYSYPREITRKLAWRSYYQSSPEKCTEGSVCLTVDLKIFTKNFKLLSEQYCRIANCLLNGIIEQGIIAGEKVNVSSLARVFALDLLFGKKLISGLNE